MPISANTTIEDVCVDKFKQLKTGGKVESKDGQEIKENKPLKYIVFKLSDEKFKDHVIKVDKELPTEPGMSDRDAWEMLSKHFVEAKVRDKKGKEVDGPRYAVFDFEYELKDGEGKRKKIALLDYCPDDLSSYWKMVHSSSLVGLKSALNVTDQIHLKDENDLEYNTVLQKIDPKADLDE